MEESAAASASSASSDATSSSSSANQTQQSQIVLACEIPLNQVLYLLYIHYYNI
jgi:hypothetical protein